MKKIILPLLILILLSSLVFAAGVKVVSPEYVVIDVPFEVTVPINTGGLAATTIQLTFVGDGVNPTFSEPSKCSNCLKAKTLDIASGTLTDGNRFLTLWAPTDTDNPFTTNDFNTNFFTFKAIISGSDGDTGSIKLYPAEPAVDDNDNFINAGVRQSITPTYNPFTLHTSVCGDDVVDTRTEQCDDGDLDNGDGCTSACKIDLINGWSCTNIYNGARHSTCTEMLPAAFFIAKMNKLLTGKCYPQDSAGVNQVGDRYCMEGTANPYITMDAAGKIVSRSGWSKLRQQGQLTTFLVEDLLLFFSKVMS